MPSSDIRNAPPAASRPLPSRSQSLRGARLVAVFFLGLLLFNFPLLTLFNSDRSVFGIPVLYAFLFFAWAVLILLMALIAERGRAPRQER